MKTSAVLSRRGLRTRQQPISWLMKQALEHPEVISLAAGFVDQESLPVDELKAAFLDLCRNPAEARGALQYGTTHGSLPLRTRLLDRLSDPSRMGKAATGISPENVVITSGSQQFLYLISEVLLDEGDIVLVGDPTYFVYVGVLESMGAKPVGIESDEHGLVPESVEAALRRIDRAGKLKRVKMIYSVSYYDNPTGMTLSVERRKALAALARKWSHGTRKIYLLEDAAYQDLRYRGPALPNIKSFDRKNEHVILTGTFSKPFSPGIKTGYAVLPEELSSPVTNIKGSHDFGSANLSQVLVERVMALGLFDRHVEKLCRTYRSKMDAMLDAMKEFLPPEVTWWTPEGGLYVWAMGPKGLDTGPDGVLFKKALARGVIYVPGEYCFCREPGRKKSRSHMRLSFGVQSPQGIREGIRRLGFAMKETLHRPDSRKAKAAEK